MSALAFHAHPSPEQAFSARYSHGVLVDWPRFLHIWVPMNSPELTIDSSQFKPGASSQKSMGLLAP